jgi:hypothetical protein
LFIVLASAAGLAAAVVRHGRARAGVSPVAYLRIVGVAPPISRLHNPQSFSQKAPHVR